MPARLWSQRFQCRIDLTLDRRRWETLVVSCHILSLYKCPPGYSHGWVSEYRVGNRILYVHTVYIFGQTLQQFTYLAYSPALNTILYVHITMPSLLDSAQRWKYSPRLTALSKKLYGNNQTALSNGSFRCSAYITSAQQLPSRHLWVSKTLDAHPDRQRSAIQYRPLLSTVQPRLNKSTHLAALLNKIVWWPIFIIVHFVIVLWGELNCVKISQGEANKYANRCGNLRAKGGVVPPSIYT